MFNIKKILCEYLDSENKGYVTIGECFSGMIVLVICIVIMAGVAGFIGYGIQQIWHDLFTGHDGFISWNWLYIVLWLIYVILIYCACELIQRVSKIHILHCDLNKDENKDD